MGLHCWTCQTRAAPLKPISHLQSTPGLDLEHPGGLQCHALWGPTTWSCFSLVGSLNPELGSLNPYIHHASAWKQSKPPRFPAVMPCAQNSCLELQAAVTSTDLLGTRQRLTSCVHRHMGMSLSCLFVLHYLPLWTCPVRSALCHRSLQPKHNCRLAFPGKCRQSLHRGGKAVHANGAVGKLDQP